jgi:hypothetical protein
VTSPAQDARATMRVVGWLTAFGWICAILATIGLALSLAYCGPREALASRSLHDVSAAEGTATKTGTVPGRSHRGGLETLQATGAMPGRRRGLLKVRRASEPARTGSARGSHAAEGCSFVSLALEGVA